jgi:ceramide glucosyltransferase
VFVRDAILLLALGPFVYYILAIWASSAYFRGNRRRVGKQSNRRPPVSILKPVRGLDREAYENFASFCLLDYPEYEILFCVNEASDPAVPVIEELQRDFPQRQIRLLIGAPHHGASGKVNKLCRLVEEASYDLLVISDSDVRVEPSYLQDVTAPFADRRVGAVTVFFRSLIAGSAGATLDAAGSSVEFAASALLSRRLEGVHFTLGATMATTKRIVREIGGFEALSNHYVDDYEVGKRITGLGYTVEFAATPVSMVYPRESLFQFLRHELRWTIGLRNVRPLGHAAMGLILGFPWTILAVLAAPTAAIASLYLLAYSVLRSATYLAIGAWGLKDSVVRRKWWLFPARDAVAFAVWVASFFSNHISWRGLEFNVKKGLLIPLGEPAGEGATSLLRRQRGRITAMEGLDGSVQRASVLIEPSVDFGTRRAQSADVSLEKTHELGS